MSDFVKGIVKLARKYRVSKRKTKEQYKSLFDNKFHGSLIFVDVIFPHNKATILYDCPKHPLPNNQHREMRVDSIAHSGCKQCDAQRRKIPQQKFIEKAKQLHQDENGNPLYDYSEVNYQNGSKKVTIICPKHGPFQQRPIDHNRANSPEGCPQCGKDKSQFGRRLY